MQTTQYEREMLASIGCTGNGAWGEYEESERIADFLAAVSECMVESTEQTA